MLSFLQLFLLLDFKMNKIAIVGSNGFLGTNLYNYLDNYKNVIRISRKNADIKLNSYTINNLTKTIKKYNLTHIINCVGFTDINNANKLYADINKFSDEQGRKELIHKLRKEMKKGVEKEYMLKEDDRVLIYNFFNKLKTEINSVEKD